MTKGNNEDNGGVGCVEWFMWWRDG